MPEEIGSATFPSRNRLTSCVASSPQSRGKIQVDGKAKTQYKTHLFEKLNNLAIMQSSANDMISNLRYQKARNEVFTTL